MTHARNIKLILEYDGTDYRGWQSQPERDERTVQETVEKAIASLTGERPALVSSGRTDAGVHALGQAANFMTTSRLPVPAWVPALNQRLPSDIRIVASEEVPPDFHARYDARGKIYRYLLLDRPAASALYRRFVWHVPYRLNVSRMRRASRHLVGRHDFSAFRSASCGAKTAVRTVRSCSIRRRDGLIEIEMEGDAFLMHMVRIIVGTLVDVGRGRIPEHAVRTILFSRDRTKAGPTAPAGGLTLAQVLYPSS